MRRQAVFTLGAALFLAAPLIAQDPPPTARRSAPATLSDSQRAQLRAIHDKYRVEFTKHREEMTALRQKMQAEVGQALPAELRERLAARGERGMRRGAIAGQRWGFHPMGGHPMARGAGGMGVPGMGMRPMARGAGRMAMPVMGRRPMAAGMAGRGLPGGAAWGMGGAAAGVRARAWAPAMRADSVQAKWPAKAAAPPAAKAKPGPR